MQNTKRCSVVFPTEFMTFSLSHPDLEVHIEKTIISLGKAQTYSFFLGIKKYFKNFLAYENLKV